MQISRHWRMNSNRYRLEGVRYANGAVSLQERPAPAMIAKEENANTKIQETNKAAQPA